MTCRPMPFPGPRNGQHWTWAHRGAHTLGLMLTWVQIWSEKSTSSSQALPGEKRWGSRREAAPESCQAASPAESSCRHRGRAPSLLPIGPGLRTLGLSFLTSLSPATSTRSTAGGTGRCGSASTPAHTGAPIGTQCDAPYSHPCLPCRLALQSQWGRSTCGGEQREVAGPTARVAAFLRHWCKPVASSQEHQPRVSVPTWIRLGAEG